MKLRSIKTRVAKGSKYTFKEVDEIIDSAMEIIMEALVDSDVIELDPLGTLELQSISILKVDDKEKPMGKLIFTPRKETLNFLIRENLKMICQEEEE